MSVCRKPIDCRLSREPTATTVIAWRTPTRWSRPLATPSVRQSPPSCVGLTSRTMASAPSFATSTRWRTRCRPPPPPAAAGPVPTAATMRRCWACRVASSPTLSVWWAARRGRATASPPRWTPACARSPHWSPTATLRAAGRAGPAWHPASSAPHAPTAPPWRPPPAPPADRSDTPRWRPSWRGPPPSRPRSAHWWGRCDPSTSTDTWWLDATLQISPPPRSYASHRLRFQVFLIVSTLTLGSVPYSIDTVWSLSVFLFFHVKQLL